MFFFNRLIFSLTVILTGLLLVSCYQHLDENEASLGEAENKTDSSNEKIIPFNINEHLVTYGDEFDDNKINKEWEAILDESIWGSEIFSKDEKYLTYGVSGNRKYLELKAYVDPDDNGTLQNYSAGLKIPDKKWNGHSNEKNPDNPFFYGYYEIESKITKGNQSMDSIGLWPAFWFQHNENDDPEPGKYWYEEVDIFEPGACQVKKDFTAFHYWTNETNDLPKSDANTWKHPEHEYFFRDVDMFNWHRWGVEWLPDRLTFYYDGKPIHTIRDRVPTHAKPAVFIDLQLNPESYGCFNPRDSSNTFIGSFLVNYFRYWRYDESNGGYKKK